MGNSFLVLKAAKKILLVDWPDSSLPLGLVNAGFEVFTYSPDKYSVAIIENGDISFEKLDSQPTGIDIVNVFRPEAELEGIIEKRVLPLAAKTVWLHPPVTSSQANELASKYRITIIQGENIIDVATQQ